MKKIIVAASFLMIALNVFSQTTDTLKPMADSLKAAKTVIITPPVIVKKKKDWSKVSLANRPNDHFMFQLGYEGWANKPDSAKTRGLSRSLGIYFMLDFPFKTDPRYSVGLGLGVSGASMFFDKTKVGIADNTNTLQFEDVSKRDHFKKYKLAYSYLEVPIEIRYTKDPENDGKSLKFALGAKVGTLVNIHTKGKTYQDSEGKTIGNYTQKLASKQYFEGIRLAGIARVGLGHFSLFGSYQINNFIKDGAGPNIKPYTIGICLSGL